MNKAVTEGLQFMPPAFSAGLADWSKSDGTPGSADWHNDPNAVIVPSDGDFGRCLEIMRTGATTRIVHKGETPLLAGCYLRITARIKAMSGNLSTARIFGWAGDAGQDEVTGLPQVGPATPLTAYGEVTEISAIVGSGARGGVDLVWGLAPAYGHFGIELTGPTGGVLRIEDIRIEDVTHVYQRDLLDWVDVRDYGAVGDGVTDDSAAFEAADQAANGRRVLVPQGTFFLNDHVTFTSEVRFAGTVTMPADKRLQVLRNFTLDTYCDAFGDEATAFKKAMQAFFNTADHDSLDLCGRSIDITEPIDVHAAIGNQDDFTIRKVVRNGQFEASASAAWEPDTATSTATYTPGNNFELTNVANIAQVPVGALVQGNGVGREVYVRDKNIAAGKLTLSQPLYDAAGTQTYTFTRFKYMLDFSGFQNLTKFIFEEIDFRCNSYASAIMLPPEGNIFHCRDCDFTKPKDRAITSIGRGCQGLTIDRCNMHSSEMTTLVADRTTVGINVNANDAKIRDTRAVRFKHFMVLKGAGHMFIGNHWFQGDAQGSAVRTAGIVFTQPSLKTMVVNNYIDNSFIEWTNEHDAFPDFNSETSFGGLTVADNIFTLNNGGTWFRWLVVKPHGPGHYVHGLTVTNNVFKSLDVRIDRVEKVDDSIAPLDLGRMRNITFDGNTFTNVDEMTVNPVTLPFSRETAEQNWVLDFAPYLPFAGNMRKVTSACVDGFLRDASGNTVFPGLSFNHNHGPDKSQARMNFPYAVRGTVNVTGRMDNPV